MIKNKNFETLDKDGKSLTLTVRVPNLEDIREADKVKNLIFKESLDSKCYLRAELDDILTKRNLWSPDKKAKLAALQKELLDNERKLAKGNIKLKDARQLALDMKRIRNEIVDLRSIFTQMDAYTCESKSENERFNKLVSLCVVKQDGSRYFNSLEDYINNSREDVARKGAEILAQMMYNWDEDSEGKLPENMFLKQYKFCNDKYQLINDKGKLVDINSKLINEEGRYITENNELCDSDGNLVDKDGNYLFDFQPFLDDEGQPINNNLVEKEDNSDIVVLDEEIDVKKATRTNSVELD